ncbi:hypothetical protein V9T40_010013 [Parthenolecanium corni]|uniref:Uncharacterized protein n=1 Tax=Parthenolecanium corni TaxID=536013 RepID=A0AAN9TK33_9HEMI
MMTGVQTCTPPRHQSSQVLYDLFGMSIICINDAAIEQRSQNGQHEDHFHVTDAEVSHSFQLLVTLGFVSREGRGRFQFVRNVTCAAAIDVDSSVAGLDFEDDDMSSPQLSELRELWI